MSQTSLKVEAVKEQKNYPAIQSQSTVNTGGALSQSQQKTSVSQIIKMPQDQPSFQTQQPEFSSRVTPQYTQGVQYQPTPLYSSSYYNTPYYQAPYQTYQNNWFSDQLSLYQSYDVMKYRVAFALTNLVNQGYQMPQNIQYDESIYIQNGQIYIQPYIRIL